VRAEGCGLEALIVDVDDQDTWPHPIAEWVGDVGSPRSDPRDLSDAIEDERQFRTLLEGRRVIAYHCTRLLEHEEAAIRRDGLRPVSLENTVERIRSACAHGHLTVRQQDELLAAVERIDRETIEARGRGTFLTVGLALFTEMTDLAAEWLGLWGGTVIYESAGARRGETHDLLGNLGRPTIVVAGLEVTDERFRPTDYFGQMFTAVAHGRHFLGGEVRCSPLVRVDEIEALWHPGDAEYERYAGLPR
jgi:hypothetical protein